MSAMRRKNLAAIKRRFEEETGVVLTPARTVPVRKLLLLAAVIACCAVMLAFTSPLFTPLEGDELSLTGTYEGNGIVSILVENRSDKKLKFQSKTRLMRWVTSEEVERLGGKPVFENTEFAPRSSGIMRVDLSPAYDVKALEESATNAEWFYLVLTNNEFLFGHDWMCSVSFGTGEPAPEETRPHAPVPAETAEQVEEALRFYFEDAYGDTLMAFNEANFQYQQKVEEILKRFPGTVVPALSPDIMVGKPSVYLDPEPMMGKIPGDVCFDEAVPREEQHLLTGSHWTYTDGFGRMVASAGEKAWAQAAVLPQKEGQTDGGVTLPLVFLFVYDADLAIPENYAFLYGRLHSFAQLEDCLVRRDGDYAIYNATDLIYTDLDAYLDYFLTTREDVFCDDAVRARVHRIYEFYQDRQQLAELIEYRPME